MLGRRRTGDETYVRNLLRELAAASSGLRLAAVTRHPELLPPGVTRIELPARSQIARMAFALPRLARVVKPRLGHFQHVIPPRLRSPAVMTVHDLSFERFPELMGIRDRVLFQTFVPRSARRAARIFAVSEWTKADLIELYGLPPEKVVVTPNAVDPLFRPDAPRQVEDGAQDGRPYVLFVGAIQPRKDPITVLEAISRLDSELRLVIVGPDKRGGRDLRRLISDWGLEGRVEWLEYVDTARLADLYRAAACLAFPSLYEGFGLPVVEAMASGTPVVAARSGAVPEIAGDAAVLVEPRDAAALAAGIERALAERDRLVRLGLERARLFSWRETAVRTLAVYRELLE